MRVIARIEHGCENEMIVRARMVWPRCRRECVRVRVRRRIAREVSERARTRAPGMSESERWFRMSARWKIQCWPLGDKNNQIAEF